MSLQPENHLAESRQILQPTHVAITNARLDHTEAWRNRREIASVLALERHTGSQFIFRKCRFRRRSPKRRIGRAKLFSCPSGQGVRFYGAPGRGPNLQKTSIWSVRSPEHDIDDGTIQRGLGANTHDIGRLGIWQTGIESRTVFFVTLLPPTTLNPPLRSCPSTGAKVPGNLEVWEF